MKLSVSFCGFVVLTNMSLQLNSLGFYQLMKILTTPTIVLIEYFWYGKTYTIKILVSLALVLCGVTLGTTGDIKFNFFGTIIALTAVIIASLYQIWVGTEQAELQVNSFQLLYYQAPISAILLLLVIMATEPEAFFHAEEWMFNSRLVIFILTTAVCAFFVNLSTFLVVGKTSPITYNVLGYFKLCVVMLGHFTFFNNPLVLQQVVGTLITIVGVVLYAHFKLQHTSILKVNVPSEQLPKYGEKL